MNCILNNRIEDVANAAYILSEVISSVSTDFDSINKARVLLFNPAQPKGKVDVQPAADDIARAQNLCGSCRKSSICNPHRNYGVIAVKCEKYVMRSGSSPAA